MATDLLYHWITSYYLGEGRRWLDQGLAAYTEPDEIRARALWTGAWLAILQADTPAATAMLEESRSIGERLRDESILGYAALYSGMIAMSERTRGNGDRAVRGGRWPGMPATEDPVGRALSLIRLSLAHSCLGDFALADLRGRGVHGRVRRARRRLAPGVLRSMALGVESWRQGDLGRATELEKESLRFNRSLGDALGVRRHPGGAGVDRRRPEAVPAGGPAAGVPA